MIHEWKLRDVLFCYRILLLRHGDPISFSSNFVWLVGHCTLAQIFISAFKSLYALLQKGSSWEFERRGDRGINSHREHQGSISLHPVGRSAMHNQGDGYQRKVMVKCISPISLAMVK